MKTPITWTQARTEKLQELWEQGKKPHEIAKALGKSFSANAVKSKAQRMRLIEVPRLAQKQQDILIARSTSFSFPEPYTCNWPLGEPDQPNFDFCREPTSPHRPYCEEHCRIAYRPLEEPRARKTRRTSQNL